MPLPVRSTKRPTNTNGHAWASPISGFATDDMPYPRATRGRRLRTSARRPDTTFITDAVPSAIPSMRPTIATGAPSTVVRNSGNTG